MSLLRSEFHRGRYTGRQRSLKLLNKEPRLLRARLSFSVETFRLRDFRDDQWDACTAGPLELGENIASAV